MVTSGMENVGAQKICQGTRKTGMEEFCHGRVFRGDEAMKCSVLKELKLTADEMLR